MEQNRNKKPLSHTHKLLNWAFKRFRNRKMFIYPSRCYNFTCNRRKRLADNRKKRFAEVNLRKELDISRFINQQRETYISYLTNMTDYQQAMCQKLAQITFDDSLTSQNSSDDGNTQFAWNVNDEENLDRLFHDKQPNSQRLVNMLRIQEDRERHSRRLQRQINKNKGLE